MLPYRLATHLALLLALCSYGCSSDANEPSGPPCRPTFRGGTNFVVTSGECPVITNLSIEPATTKLGSEVSLTVLATDPDSERLVFTWRATAGLVDDKTSAQTKYRCTDPGVVTLAVAVSDGACTDYAVGTIECVP